MTVNTFGGFPGVEVETSGGGIAGIQLGDEEILVIFGEGDANNASASVNSPTQISAQTEADSVFGSGSELAQAMKDANANGANLDFLYGVMLDRQTATAEDITGGGDAADHTGGSKISNTPIEEDTGAITVEDDQGNPISVEFRYERNTDDTASDFTSLSPGTDTMFINPHTGEWIADASDDYNIDYEYFDWQSALDSADTVLAEDDTGIYACLDESQTVQDLLDTKVDDLRSNYKMVQGIMAAEPNNSSTESPPDARFDTANYADSTENDALYLVAPGRVEDAQRTIVGGVGGLFAGNTISEPVYNDALSNFDALEQQLTGTEPSELDAEQVIPVVDAGSIRVKRNLSTSTESDWERDLWRRRILDRIVLITKQVGDNTVGKINDQESRDEAEESIFRQLDQMVDDRLLKPNTSDTQNWFVNVTEDANNTNQVNIRVGATPRGIAKRIDINITFNA